MTVFESFKIKNIDELAEWLDDNWMDDDSPWILWWDKKYCDNCECVLCEAPYYFGGQIECSYCEVNDRCRFFEDRHIDDILDNKAIAKMWLESEVNDGI